MGTWGRPPTPRHVRLAVLERDQWRCQLGYSGCTYHATVVDHITSTAALGVTREQVGPDGCQAACASCHAIKTAAEKRARVKNAVDNYYLSHSRSNLRNMPSR